MRLASGLSIGIGLAVLVAHLRFVAIDVRLPRDMGLYFASLPDLHAALSGPAPFEAAGRALLQPGGWYNLLLSIGVHLFGRTPHVLDGLDLFWLMSILVVLTSIARHLGGPVAGLTAIALAGAFHLFVVDARYAWIHIPELALVLGVLWAWMRDFDFQRRRTIVIMGVLGALAIMLRYSALIWLGTIVPMLVWRLREPKTRWMVAGLLGLWGICFLVQVDAVVPYLQRKVMHRARYIATQPDIFGQFQRDVGLVPGLVAFFGLAMCMVYQRGWVKRLLVVWIALAAFLLLGFGVGSNNFSPYGAGLAILGGWGLARWPRVGSVVAMVAFLTSHVPQWVPVNVVSRSARKILRPLRIPFYPAPGNYYRPYTGAGPPEILERLQAACPDVERTCEVVIAQGLFHPFGEDPGGSLELFFAQVDHVRVVDVRLAVPEIMGQQPAALLHFECGERNQAWRQRYPDSAHYLQQVIDRYDLQTVDELYWSNRCTLVWMAPG